MSRAAWLAAPNGRYWIDISLGATPCRLMVDTGLVDPAGQVGFEVEPAMFDALDQSGQLLPAVAHIRRDSSGRLTRLKAGFVAAQLLDPVAGTPIGPRVQCLVVRNLAGVPSRVGVVFFHRLIGCRVVWELVTRTWCVEYP